MIDNRTLLQGTFPNDKWKKNDKSFLSFSHRAKDGVWKNVIVILLIFYTIKIISTMVEREYIYTRHNATDFLCISIDWFLYDKRFY